MCDSDTRYKKLYEEESDYNQLKEERNKYLNACIDLAMQYSLIKEKCGHLEAELKTMKQVSDGKDDLIDMLNWEILGYQDLIDSDK